MEQTLRDRLPRLLNATRSETRARVDAACSTYPTRMSSVCALSGGQYSPRTTSWTDRQATKEASASVHREARPWQARRGTSFPDRLSGVAQRAFLVPVKHGRLTRSSAATSALLPTSDSSARDYTLGYIVYMGWERVVKPSDLS